MSLEAIVPDFVEYACQKLEQSTTQIERCAALLSSQQVWHRPNDHSNSIGNLVLHLTGNVRQWIVSALGGEAFQRDRPAEFAQRGPLPTEQVVGELARTVRRAVETIRRLDQRRLAQRQTIQGYDVSALVAVFHVVEHFSLHTGQIVYATKLVTDADLSQYDSAGHKTRGTASWP